jgi:hypothetical protein
VIVRLNFQKSKRVLSGSSSLTKVDNVLNFLECVEKQDWDQIQFLWLLQPEEAVQLCSYFENHIIPTFVKPQALEAFKAGGGIITTKSVSGNLEESCLNSEEWLWGKVDPLQHMITPDKSNSLVHNDTKIDDAKRRKPSLYYTGKEDFNKVWKMVLI